MKEAKSIDIKVDKKQWTISAKDFIANIELFSYNRNRLKENRELKTLPPINRTLSGLQDPAWSPG